MTEVDMLMHSVVEAVFEPVLIVQADGIIRYANGLAHYVFGYPPRELVGVSVEQLVPLAVRGRHPQLRADYLKAPIARPMGMRRLSGVRKDGGEIPVDLTLTPTKYDNEWLTVVVCRSVTPLVMPLVMRGIEADGLVAVLNPLMVRVRKVELWGKVTLALLALVAIVIVLHEFGFAFTWKLVGT